MSMFSLQKTVNLRGLTAMHAGIVMAVTETLRETGEDRLAYAQGIAPVKEGDYKNRLATWMEDGMTVAVGTKPSKPEKDWSIELGSGPHIIAARTKRFLAFEKQGRLIIRRRVRHPGTPAQHILGRTMVHAKRVFLQKLHVKIAALKAGHGG